MTSFVAPSSPVHFRHYLRNGAISGRKLLNIKCVILFSLQVLFEKFVIQKIIQRDIFIKMKAALYKVLIILIRF